MPISIVTPAAALPIGIITALRHMRVLQQDADMATLCLKSATDAVEDYTGRSLVNKTYLLTIPFWPTKVNCAGLRYIELRRTPLVSVASVKYYAAGVLTTLVGGSYIVDTFSTPGQLTFLDSTTYPTADKRNDAIQISFVAGYGTDETAMPGRAVQAVLLFARSLYDNRDPRMDNDKNRELPYSLKHMLRSLRVDSVAPEL